MRNPTEQQIKTDNEHFVGDITYSTIIPVDLRTQADFGFTRQIGIGCTGNNARAVYLWHPLRNRWELGIN